jgi:hypothetical protein
MALLRDGDRSRRFPLVNHDVRVAAVPNPWNYWSRYRWSAVTTDSPHREETSTSGTANTPEPLYGPDAGCVRSPPLVKPHGDVCIGFQHVVEHRHGVRTKDRLHIRCADAVPRTAALVRRRRARGVAQVPTFLPVFLLPMPRVGLVQFRYCPVGQHWTFVWRYETRFVSDQDLGTAQDLSAIAPDHVAVAYGDRS